MERKRAEREESFRRMQLEALLLGEGSEGVTGERPRGEDSESLRGASVEELLAVLEGGQGAGVQAKRLLREHLHSHSPPPSSLQRGLREEEELLQSLSIAELFALSRDSSEGLFSDFLVQRARQLLDVALS